MRTLMGQACFSKHIVSILITHSLLKEHVIATLAHTFHLCLLGQELIRFPVDACLSHSPLRLVLPLLPVQQNHSADPHKDTTNLSY